MLLQIAILVAQPAIMESWRNINILYYIDSGWRYIFTTGSLRQNLKKTPQTKIIRFSLALEIRIYLSKFGKSVEMREFFSFKIKT